MRVPDIPRVGCIVVVLCAGVAIAAQDGDLKKRLTPREVDSVRAEVAGAGTSGVPAVTTRVLFGDPRRAGLYTIELRIAPNTTIQPHTHRDMRTAVVMAGVWYFGYGPNVERTLEKALARGSFYTEPGGQLHFARTGPEGATVAITGNGPSDTVYAK